MAKQAVIFHNDLPVEIRHAPYDRRNAGRLSKAVWRAAEANKLTSPFDVARMSDRIVIRELEPAGEKRAEVAA